MRNRLIEALTSAVIAISVFVGGGQPALSLPVAPPAPEPVAGIPAPCVSRVAWPQDASPAHTRNLLQKRFGIRLVGPGWNEAANRPLVKIIWQTLDALSCTDYLATTKARARSAGAPALVIKADRISGWAWGDWGLTTPNALTFDFAKWHEALRAGDPGRLVRLVVHEMGHAYASDRFEDPAYWTSFTRLYQQHGTFSHYGRDASESFSEVIGYYVARCARENPYNTVGSAQNAYYDWARRTIFHGMEFGPGQGSAVDCRGTTVMAGGSRPVVEPAWVAPRGAARR